MLEKGIVEKVITVSPAKRLPDDYPPHSTKLDNSPEALMSATNPDTKLKQVISRYWKGSTLNTITAWHRRWRLLRPVLSLK